MYCPHCGQQQISAQIRFCSRCGFPLGTVAELLANNGFLPQFAAARGEKSLITRRNVFLFGLMWFFVLTFLLTPVFAVLNFESIAPLFAILGFMGGIIVMMGSLFFPKQTIQRGDSLSAQREYARQQFIGGNLNQNALPPQPANFNSVNNAVYTPPASKPPHENWREANTNELVMPPSVTEDTTKLLEKEQ